MPVLEAVQTFAGIANENGFYSHHDLGEAWQTAGQRRLLYVAMGRAKKEACLLLD